MTALVSPAEGSLMSDFPPGLGCLSNPARPYPGSDRRQQGPEFSCCSGCSAQSRRHGGSAMRSSWARKSDVPLAAKVSGVTRQSAATAGLGFSLLSLCVLVRAPGLPRA